jgi:hypothetical protein
MRGSSTGKYPAVGGSIPDPTPVVLPPVEQQQTHRESSGPAPRPPTNAPKYEGLRVIHALVPPLPAHPQATTKSDGTRTQAVPTSPRGDTPPWPYPTDTAAEPKVTSHPRPPKLTRPNTNLSLPPTPPTPPTHPDNLTAHIERLVAHAPPLSQDQRAALRAILTTHDQPHTP